MEREESIFFGNDLSSGMFLTGPVQDHSELRQILDLQQLYLRGKSSRSEEKEQGFLTVIHDFDALLCMHSLEPSVIVKENQTLAGYALVMARECGKLIPELMSMFKNFDLIEYQNKPVNEYSFYVMGQVCVAKPYRGQGVFDMLYGEHRNLYKKKYDFIVTEISTSNHRSLRAHERVGFKPIYQFRDEIDEWLVVLWDWT
jgi:ribosomal protein S18 acetylase RimI-like enzyme